MIFFFSIYSFYYLLFMIFFIIFLWVSYFSIHRFKRENIFFSTKNCYSNDMAMNLCIVLFLASYYN